MIQLKILDIKSFMEKLFKETIFDDFEVASLELKAITDFKISGTLNTDYYSTDELQLLNNRNRILWSDVKSIIYTMIKGNKQPSSIKLVFALPMKKIESLLNQNDLSINVSQINDLFLNIKFDRTGLYCITGTSLKIFIPDKTLEHLWDDSTKKFFKKNIVPFESI